MAAKDPSIWIMAQAVQDCIQVVDGTGDWNYDLSGSGTVVFDEQLNTKSMKVIIGPVVVSPIDATIQRNYKTVEYYIFATVGSQTNYSNRFEASMRLAHDIARSLSTLTIRAAMNAIDSGRGNDNILRTRVDTLQCGGLPDYNNLGTLQMILTIDIGKDNSGSSGGF